MAFASAAFGWWSGCGDDASNDAPDPSGASSYGAEITVTVVGRGRVTTATEPKGIDCPGTCFARAAFVPGHLDARVTGVSLGVEPGARAHFVKWTFEALPLGIRSTGPDSCSPMKRTSTIPTGIELTGLAITLPLGEGNAEPPLGREEECAHYTRTPLAYAVTATFADDGPDAGALDASTEAAFMTPVPGVEARELGVVGGFVYWRYLSLGDNRSGIAAATTGGGPAIVVVDASDLITTFDVDAHVVYQRGGQPTLWTIPGGTTNTFQLQNAPFCDAVASHSTSIYCRLSSGTQIYQWSAGGGFPTYVYAVPRGFDLAVDDVALYFSEENGGGTGNALIRSGPRVGGAGAFPLVVIGQTTPRDLRVRSGWLFWLDGLTTTTGVRSARAALTSSSSGREAVAIPGARLIAPDPDVAGTFWAGVFTEGKGFSIVRADAQNTAGTTATIRSNLPRMNGLAVDSAYVYWTQGDRGVYRALKPRF